MIEQSESLKIAEIRALRDNGAQAGHHHEVDQIWRNHLSMEAGACAKADWGVHQCA